MSADNGVYILVTRGSRGKKEYRVAHAQAIENLFSEFSDDPRGVLNVEYAHLLFGKSRVFTDMKLAGGYAQRIYDEWMDAFGIVEYRIVTLYYSHIRFPQASVESEESQEEEEERDEDSTGETYEEYEERLGDFPNAR